MAGWCTSVVAGKDAVPRSSTNNLRRLMDEMITALARSRCAAPSTLCVLRLLHVARICGSVPVSDGVARANRPASMTTMLPQRAARLRRYHKLRVLLGGFWRKENRPPSDRLFRPYKDLPEEARDFLVKCASTHGGCKPATLAVVSETCSRAAGWRARSCSCALQ